MVRKVITTALVVVLLLTSMAFSVSANDSGYLSLKQVFCFDKDSNSWVDRTKYSSWAKSGDYYVLGVDNPNAYKLNYWGVWAIWTAAAYMKLDYGQVLDVNISFWDYVDMDDVADGLKVDYLRIVFNDNTYVDVPSSSFKYDKSTTKWYIQYLVTLDNVVESVQISTIEFRCEIPSYNSGANDYIIRVDSSFKAIDSPELQQHKELITVIGDSADRIISNQNTNTDKIIANQNANADKIVNSDFGYSVPSNKVTSDSDISDIAGQISSLSGNISSSVRDFKTSIDGLKAYMNSGKQFVWGWLNYVPGWFTAIITGFAGLLIARKIVK